MALTVAILTSAFPFYPGEQFIEAEIGYWAKTPGVRVLLVPATAKGVPRPVPGSVSVELGMARSTPASMLAAAFRAFGSPIFRHEIRHLLLIGNLGPRTGLRALVHTAKVFHQAKRLERIARAIGGVDVAYAYWNETQSYAAALCKRHGLVRRLVSRAHGFDLYENRRRHGYMPLKRQFIADHDLVFPLSDEGKTYLQDVYVAQDERVLVSRLGVPVPDVVSTPGDIGGFHVVSVSFCNPVKRIDRIIQALKCLATRNRQLRVQWTHIGGGPLLDDLRSMADELLGPEGNVSFEFVGDLPNEAVRAFFVDMPVDAFINTSESEGVPVSIMEAMSTGVPAIAPDVGGVSSLVSMDCGVLMSSAPDTAEIAAALESVARHPEAGRLRRAARKVVQERFNAATNYPAFIAEVVRGS